MTLEALTYVRTETQEWKMPNPIQRSYGLVASMSVSNPCRHEI